MRHIVGGNMLSAFGHPVARYYDVSRRAGLKFETGQISHAKFVSS